MFERLLIADSGPLIGLAKIDRLGRREAARLGLIFFGVIGLLKEAKLRGLIPLLGPELTSLLEAEYHLSPQLVADALRSVGEPPLP
jgi:predicted nucleic acid-binding protein